MILQELPWGLSEMITWALVFFVAGRIPASKYESKPITLAENVPLGIVFFIIVAYFAIAYFIVKLLIL